MTQKQVNEFTQTATYRYYISEYTGQDMTVEQLREQVAAWRNPAPTKENEYWEAEYQRQMSELKGR